MCIDMCQADRSLRRSGHCNVAQARADCHLAACAEAAKIMGYEHYVHVPDNQLEEYLALRRTLHEAMVKDKVSAFPTGG